MYIALHNHNPDDSGTTLKTKKLFRRLTLGCRNKPVDVGTVLKSRNACYKTVDVHLISYWELCGLSKWSSRSYLSKMTSVSAHTHLQSCRDSHRVLTQPGQTEIPLMPTVPSSL